MRKERFLRFFSVLASFVYSLNSDSVFGESVNRKMAQKICIFPKWSARIQSRHCKIAFNLFLMCLQSRFTIWISLSQQIYINRLFPILIFQDMVMVIPAIFSDFHHPIGIDKSNKTHFCLNFKFLMCLYQTVDVDFCFGFRLKRVRNV